MNLAQNPDRLTPLADMSIGVSIGYGYGHCYGYGYP